TEDALAVSRSDHDMAYWVGVAYSLLGETDLAFKWLNRAVKLGNQNRPHFEHDDNLAELRKDPRFDELLKKMTDEGLLNAPPLHNGSGRFDRDYSFYLSLYFVLESTGQVIALLRKIL